VATNNRFEHIKASGCINPRCHLAMTDDGHWTISSRKSNEEHEKLNFHSLSRERHKNRIKANELEFMRLPAKSHTASIYRHDVLYPFPSLPRCIAERNWFPILYSTQETT